MMWSGSLKVGNINADVKPEEMVYIVTALLLLWCDDEILLISKRTTVHNRPPKPGPSSEIVLSQLSF